MRVYRISSSNATDYSTLYKYLENSLEYLNTNYVGKAKAELKKAIKKVNEMRPDLRNKRRKNGFLAQ